VVKRFIIVYIWNNSLQDYVEAGQLACDPAFMNGIVGFQYAQEYIDMGLPALDPAHLDPKENRGYYVVPLGGGILPHYFKQFLPGPFADQLLSHNDESWATLSEFEKLYYATSFYGDFHAVQLNPAKRQTNDAVEGLDDLGKIVDQIREFQEKRKETILDKSSIMALCNSTGKRPKIDFFNSAEGKRQLVKLNNGSFYCDADMLKAMEVLQNASGISTTSGVVEELPNGEKVIFQDNYTSAKLPAENGMSVIKLNRVNFKVLLGNFEARNSDTRITYQQMVGAIREYSACPEEDIEELHRRAIFAAAINQTCNGLENTEMYDLGNGEWRLAPSYSALPNPYHDTEFQVPFDDNLVARNLFSLDNDFVKRMAVSFDLPAITTGSVLEQVQEAIKANKATLSLSVEDAKTLDRAIGIDKDSPRPKPEAESSIKM